MSDDDRSSNLATSGISMLLIGAVLIGLISCRNGGGVAGEPPPIPKGQVFGSASCVDTGSTAYVLSANVAEPLEDQSSITSTLNIGFDVNSTTCCGFVFVGEFEGQEVRKAFSCDNNFNDVGYSCEFEPCS